MHINWAVVVYNCIVQLATSSRRDSYYLNSLSIGMGSGAAWAIW